MIPVNKIPTTLHIDHWQYRGDYTTDSGLTATEYTWWKDGSRDTAFPHFSVVKSTSDNPAQQGKLDTAAGYGRFDGNSAEVTKPGGLDGSKAETKKVWLLRRFHISVPYGLGTSSATNGHIFYFIDSSQHVQFSGDNRKYVRSEYRQTFIESVNRRAFLWDLLAVEFYKAAITGDPQSSFFPLAPRVAPPIITVGPQTSASFDSEEGL
jgi:hypothetical protein